VRREKKKEGRMSKEKEREGRQESESECVIYRKIIVCLRNELDL
jgi:hypothetical protein